MLERRQRLAERLGAERWERFCRWFEPRNERTAHPPWYDAQRRGFACRGGHEQRGAGAAWTNADCRGDGHRQRQ
jgi:hypothetical protein